MKESVYKINGITCESCVAKVKELVTNIKGVESVELTKESGEAVIKSPNIVSLWEVKDALLPYPKYSVENIQKARLEVKIDNTITATTYKPLIIILFYLMIVTVYQASTQISAREGFMEGMRIFMSGFFLVFSFFKMLDLKGFVSSYAMYDIIAKRIPSYGYIYVFIELGLGIAYMTGYKMDLINWITIIVMGISLIGVVESVMNKRKIKCACLGSVFNLPMTSVTIIEDSLMIAMAVLMVSL